MRASLLLATAFALGGCGLSRPSIEPASYYLSAARDTTETSAPKQVVMRMQPLRVAPIYDRREFVYRVDGARVVSDFYNEFAESPDTMITAAVTEWLRGSRMFKAVLEPRVPIDTPYTLDGTIVALYGDFRETGRPAAMLGIHFYLVHTDGASRAILLDRLLEERVEISAQTAQALVQGYNTALSRILVRLERELTSLELTRATVTQQ
jgi:cholesterol transport system auxiliary component